ncbi:hypothetical protein BD410DRAFT_839415 [Rickenella mellea]|uniref:Uncharacterized protein n=1 Tax=Rickenella mellea TaxID=50990 RepID=A0A4Y7Q5U9_9AGAM|nr:hypothetical protein BD410DRAFT_839415 [Rickenella mellea]
MSLTMPMDTFLRERAMQSLTSSTAFSTSTDGSSGGQEPAGASPLIPSLLITGLLTTCILVMMTWRRVHARRMYGPGGGLIDDERRREEDLVPAVRPELWDVWAEKGEEVDEVCDMRWANMMPLSVSFVRHIPPPSSPPPQPLVSAYSYPPFLPGPHIGHWRPRKSKPSADHARKMLPVRGQMNVAVLIAMPSPHTRVIHDSTSLTNHEGDILFGLHGMECNVYN